MIPINGQKYHIIFTTDVNGHPYQGPGEYTGETMVWRYRGDEGKGCQYRRDEVVTLYGFEVEGRLTTYYVPDSCIFEHGYFRSSDVPYCQIDLGIAVELVLRNAMDRFKQEGRLVGTVNPEVMESAMCVVRSWLSTLDLYERGSPPAIDDPVNKKRQTRHVFEHQVRRASEHNVRIRQEEVTATSATPSLAERLKMNVEAAQKPKPDGKAGDAPRA